MKKILLSLSFIIIGLSVFSQSDAEQYIKKLMAEKGYSWSATKYAYLSEGESARFTRTFYGGTSYIVVAFSEYEDVYDTDVYLYGDEGELLKESTSSGDFDAFDFEPSWTQEMTLKFKNYDSYSSSREYKCKLMIFYN